MNKEELLEQAFKFFDKNKTEEAYKIYNEIMKLYPNNADAYVWMAESYLSNEGDNDKAKECLLKALKVDPNNAGVHKLLAWADELEDKSIVINHLKRAIELEPTWMWPRISLILELVDINPREAKFEIDEAYKFLDCNFPIPDNQMDRYYEYFITGRTLGEKAKRTLDKYKEIVEKNLVIM